MYFDWMDGEYESDVRIWFSRGDEVVTEGWDCEKLEGSVSERWGFWWVRIHGEFGEWRLIHGDFGEDELGFGGGWVRVREKNGFFSF
jgi:hypothetical protein